MSRPSSSSVTLRRLSRSVMLVPLNGSCPIPGLWSRPGILLECSLIGRLISAGSLLNTIGKVVESLNRYEIGYLLHLWQVFWLQTAASVPYTSCQANNSPHFTITMDRIYWLGKNRSSVKIRGKLNISLSKIGKNTLQLKFMENPTCLWMQYSSKLVCSYRISVTLEPRGKKVTHFREVKPSLIYHNIL